MQFWPTMPKFGAFKNRSLSSSLDQLSEAVETIWDQGNPRIIQDYTDHGPKHCERVAEYIYKLLKLDQKADSDDA